MDEYIIVTECCGDTNVASFRAKDIEDAYDKSEVYNHNLNNMVLLTKGQAKLLAKQLDKMLRGSL